MASPFGAVFSNAQSSAALLGACVGVLGSLLVALATTLLNRGKFKREFLWEKRQEACNDIVASFYRSFADATAIRDGFSEDAHGFYGSGELRTLNQSYAEKISVAHTAFQTNYLILPPRFRKRYEQLEREREEWWFSSGPEVYLGQIEANARAHGELFDLARLELGLIPAPHGALIRARLAWRRVGAVAKGSWRLVRRRLGRSRKPDEWPNF